MDTNNLTDLLQRAADKLQNYCEEINGDMNDSLAMEIEAVLRTRDSTQHHIIIYGNPADGFEYIGPFESHEDAMRYAESDRYLAGAGDWWIVLLQAPAWEADGGESDDVRYSNAPDVRGFLVPANKPEDNAGVSDMPHLTERGTWYVPFTGGMPGVGKSAIVQELMHTYTPRPEHDGKQRAWVICHELLHLIMQHCPEMFGGDNKETDDE